MKKINFLLDQKRKRQMSLQNLDLIYSKKLEIEKFRKKPF